MILDIYMFGEEERQIENPGAVSRRFESPVR